MGPFQTKNLVYVGKSPSVKDVINIFLKDDALSINWIHIKMTINDAPNHWMLLLAKVSFFSLEASDKKFILYVTKISFHLIKCGFYYIIAMLIIF